MEMSQAEYARYKKVSKAYISNLIKVGKISPVAWEWVGKRRVINVELADRALSGNLNPAFTKKIKPKNERSGPYSEMTEMELDDLLIDVELATQAMKEWLESPVKTPESSTGNEVVLSEALEQFRLAVLEQRSFAKTITEDILEIAKTGDFDKLKSDLFNKIDMQYVNVFLIALMNIQDRYGISWSKD